MAALQERRRAIWDGAEIKNFALWMIQASSPDVRFGGPATIRPNGFVGREAERMRRGANPLRRENLAEDGYEGTSPIGAFPANGYGLYDMIGNVWEWTASVYALPRAAAERQSCCQAKEVVDIAASRVVKGGSHLCAPNYCLRYRPSARQSQPMDTSTTHIGFRCVVR